MSDDFNLKTLIGLVRAARALAARGDSLPEPMPDDHRKIMGAAIHAWIDRIVTAHTAPGDDAPDLSIRDLLSMAKACDALVTKGDGHPAPVSDDLVSVTYAASQVLLSRVAKHPNGDLVAEGAVNHPTAAAARAVARKARENIAARPPTGASPAPAPVAAPEAAAFPPAPPVPAGDLPPAQPTLKGDAFLFGQPPAPKPPAAPELEPLDLDPTSPAPAAQPVAGQPQAQ